MNYTLAEDVQYGIEVDVSGSVDLYDKKLTRISIQFGRVSGTFDCGNNQLTGLKNCPTSVGEDFDCYNNEDLGEYQNINDFNVIKEKILSDNEKKLLCTSLSETLLRNAVLKL